MNSVLDTAYDEKVASLTATYIKEGFDVIAEPNRSQLPFNLGNYVPDLIATKGDAGLIVEVRTKMSSISVDKLQSIASEVSTHPGWRFLLVTLEDVDDQGIPTTAEELPSWQQLNEKVDVARSILSLGAVDAALLYLWGVFEAALRKRALCLSIPVERLPAAILVNHMYSQGEISVNDLDLFLDFMGKRNRVAHGANEAVEPAMLASLFQKIGALLVEWSGE